MRFQFTRSIIAFAIAFYLAIAASACQASQPTPSLLPLFPTIAPAPPLGASVLPSPYPLLQTTSGRALGFAGRFVFTPGDGSIVVEDAANGNPRTVFSGREGIFAESPAFLPDGKQIAFAASAFGKDGGLVQDIRVMNVDGSQTRVVVPGEVKVMYNYPAISPDGKTLYVTKAFAIQGQEKNEIARVDLSASDGVLVKMIDGREASVSPDGKKTVFLRLDPKTYTSSMWIANIDGTDAKQLLASGAFAALLGARFSPDSRAIVFAASGPPNQKLPGARASADDACVVSFAFLCLLERADAHGLPWDLWIVDVESVKFERLTEIGADSPVPVWSPDGKFIVFFDATGIYAVNRATKTISQISSSHGYGGFDWR